MQQPRRWRRGKKWDSWNSVREKATRECARPGQGRAPSNGRSANRRRRAARVEQRDPAGEELALAGEQEEAGENQRDRRCQRQRRGFVVERIEKPAAGVV